MSKLSKQEVKEIARLAKSFIGNRKPITNESVTDLDSNSVGSTDLRKNRKQAQHLMLDVKVSEREKILMGYKWMIKDKTAKLVHPDKIEQNLNDGFKLTKTGRA